MIQAGRGGDLCARWLSRVAEGLAVAGGLVLVAVVLVTVASVVGRTTIGRPIPGDFELVELGTAIAVFTWLPYGQLAGGQVAVHALTAQAPAGVRRGLDVFAHLVLAVIAALLCWRVTLGTLSLRSYGDGTMVLGLPLWWASAVAAPCCALLCLAALQTARRTAWPRSPDVDAAA